MKPPSERYNNPRTISGVAIRRPIATLMAMSVFLVLGGQGLDQLTVDLLPRVEFPFVAVFVEQSETSAESIEENVAKPIEAALAGTEGVTEMFTQVQPGSMFTRLQFDFDVNIDDAYRNAASRLDFIRSALPDDASNPTIVQFDPLQIPVMEIALTTRRSQSDEDLRALQAFVSDTLDKELRRVDGVASLTIQGGLADQIEVILQPDKLASLGLTALQVAEVLSRENVSEPLGTFISGSVEIPTRARARLNSLDEIRGLPVPLPNGTSVPLREIAQVRDWGENNRLQSRLLRNEASGSQVRQAVRVSVQRRSNASTVDVAVGVRDRLQELSELGVIPEGIDYLILRDQSEQVDSALGAVTDSALAGGVLAMIVMLLFLGSIRQTLIIGVSIPLSIFFTFLLMAIFDLSLNVVSLGGLALGIGILVDQSIVVLENIARIRRQKSDPLEAATYAANEVTSAVAAGTITNVMAVIPFLFIGGFAALIFSELVFTLTFSVVASMLVAITLVPMLGAQMYRFKWSSGISEFLIIRGFQAGIERLKWVYQRALRWVLRRKLIVIVVALYLTGLAYYLVIQQGQNLLPTTETAEIQINLALEAGTTFEDTLKVVDDIEAVLGSSPEVNYALIIVGGGQFSQNVNANRAFFVVDLVDADQREATTQEFIAELEREMTRFDRYGATIRIEGPENQGAQLAGGGEELAVEIRGENTKTILETADELKALLEAVAGVSDFDSDFLDTIPEVVVIPRREDLISYGLTTTQVTETAKLAQAGRLVGRMDRGDREIDIELRFDRDQYRSLADLNRMPLLPGQGRSVKLGQVADVSYTEGAPRIQRVNQQRIAELTAKIQDRENLPITDAVARVEAAILDYEPPAGIIVNVAGESDEIQETLSDMILATLLGIFLVLVVMAVQYESIVNPFAIFFSIPLIGIGVGLGFFFTDIPISSPVALGIVILVGIVVNNGILLVEYFEIYRKRGHTLYEAILLAAPLRLRPILMTSITTIMGTLPLALGLSEGGEVLQPLGLTVVFGLTASMVLTLFVTPVFYVIAQRVAEMVRWIAFRDGTSPFRAQTVPRLPISDADPA